MIFEIALYVTIFSLGTFFAGVVLIIIWNDYDEQVD